MDYKIVIDAGHGGTDLGITNNSFIEKDITLEISKYMKQRFDELEIPVSMTREDDTTLNLEERVAKAKKFYGDEKNVILISNHLNADSEKINILYALRNNDDLAKMISEEITSEVQSNRNYYQLRLPSDPNKDYHSIIRDTGNLETIQIEYGLDSYKDDMVNTKKTYVEAIIKGITNYIKKLYKAPSGEIYIVITGDSLWTIANKFGITVDELKKINNLNSNLITVGQTLKIPNLESTIKNNSLTYIVEKGDTLYGIASKYGINTQDIIEKNNLKSTVLSVGQKIIIEK